MKIELFLSTGFIVVSSMQTINKNKPLKKRQFFINTVNFTHVVRENVIFKDYYFYILSSRADYIWEIQKIIFIAAQYYGKGI